jgi:hypothetical protein
MPYIGDWFRFGVTTADVTINNDSLLGDQSHCFNLSYCKSGLIYSSQKATAATNPEFKGEKRITPNTVLGIKWNQTEGSFTFYYNGQPTVMYLVEEKSESYFPAVQISYSSHVTITRSTFKGVEPQKCMFNPSKDWRVIS